MYLEEHKKQLDKYHKLLTIHTLGCVFFIIAIVIFCNIWSSKTTENVSLINMLLIVTWIIPIINPLSNAFVFPNSFDINDNTLKKRISIIKIILLMSGKINNIAIASRLQPHYLMRNWNSYIYPVMNIIGFLLASTGIAFITYNNLIYGIAYIILSGLYYLYQSISIPLCRQWQKYNHLYIYGTEEDKYEHPDNEIKIKKRKKMMNKIGIFFWILPFVINVIIVFGAYKESTQPSWFDSVNTIIEKQEATTEKLKNLNLDKSYDNYQDLKDYDVEETENKETKNNTTSDSLQKLQETTNNLNKIKESLKK